MVEQLGRSRAVEDMVSRIVCGGRELTANARDLVQMVYEIVLTYDEDKIVDLWENGQLGYFVARIIRTQAFSTKSPYWYAIRRFSSRSEELGQIPDRL